MDEEQARDHREHAHDGEHVKPIHWGDTLRSVMVAVLHVYTGYSPRHLAVEDHLTIGPFLRHGREHRGVVVREVPRRNLAIELTR